MRRRIVILGGGTGGTIMANRLRRVCGADEAEITVVDRDDAHIYQPGLLFVPFGLAEADQLVRPRHRQLHRDIASSRRRSTASTRPRTRCTWATARALRLRRPDRRDRRAARAGGDRGHDRAGLARDGVPVLHARGRDRARRRARALRGRPARREPRSTCRSSARSPRSSSRSWRTGTCASAGSATARSSST